MSESADSHVPLSPYEPPPEPLWTPPAEAGPEVPAIRPVPFEDREALPGFWSRVGAMFQLVFTHPFELFERVPATEGLGAPWGFLLLLSVPIFLVLALIFFFVGATAALTALDEHGTKGRAVAAFMPLILGAILLLLPLFSFLGMLIGGAVNHFFLWMWGGLRPGVGLSQTIRAYGYAAGFLQLFQLVGLIPYLGLLIQLAGMVVIGMGLARMHRTDSWRGICAALTPLVLVCCCGLALAAVMIPILVAAGHY